MKDAALDQPDIPSGHFQRVDDQARAHVVGQRVADDHPGAAIDDGGQIHPSGPRAHIGDVTDQLGARRRRGEVPPAQISRADCGVVGDRGDPERAGLAGHQALDGHDLADQLRAGLDPVALQLGMHPPIPRRAVGILEDLDDPHRQHAAPLSGR